MSIEVAVAALLREDLLVIPTETVYGLAASIHSEKALKNVFNLKSRPLLDPLIVHVGNLKQAKEITKNWSPLADALGECFWPGPLTLVMEKAKSISSLITANRNTVAIRMPQHPLTLRLINKLGIPLAAPSANRFGHISPTLIEHVEQDLVPEIRKQKKTKPLLALDGGPCALGLESTVLQIEHFTSSEQKESYLLDILRPGPIPQGKIQTLLEKKGIQAQWKTTQKRTGQASSQKANQKNLPLCSPGQMDSHYAPNIPFVLCKETPQEKHQKEWATYFQLSSPLCRPVELILNANPVQAAQELYGKMRAIEEKASQQDVMFFVFRQEVHQGEIWQAILDRIQKAVSQNLNAF